MDEKITKPLTDNELDAVSGGITWASDKKPEPVSEIPCSTYTVKKGDTLFKISTALGVSMDDLVKWNQDSHPGLKKNRSLIYEGWELVYFK